MRKTHKRHEGSSSPMAETNLSAVGSNKTEARNKAVPNPGVIGKENESRRGRTEGMICSKCR